MADQEKEASSAEHVGDVPSDVPADLERLGEENGYITDVEKLKTLGAAYEHLRLTPDGKTVLIPQPSEDPNDPLNWSQTRKHIILFIIAFVSFLPDYGMSLFIRAVCCNLLNSVLGSATGAVTLIPQAEIWHMTQDHVNHSQVGNVFMLGAGGLFLITLAAYFGRLPTLFWFTLTGVWTAAWCAGAKTFESFMAARILNGFFSTVSQGVSNSYTHYSRQI